MTNVSGSTTDITIAADNDVWTFATVVRVSEDGGVITSRPKRAKPIGGFLRVNLHPGPTIVNVSGETFKVMVPEEDCTLKELVEAGLAYPPNTSQELLAAAVDQYVAEHTAEWTVSSMELDGSEIVSYVQVEEIGRLDLEPIIPGAIFGNIAGDVANQTDIVGSQPKVRTKQAVVCFTFDDAFATDWIVVKPILDAAGIKAGFAIPSSSPGGSNLSWAQVKSLQDDGHEIIAHTTDHAHVNDGSGLTESQKRAKIDNRSVYASHGVQVRGFAYTFGEHDANLRRIVRDYYDYALATTQTGASGSQNPLSTYCIRRINLDNATSTATHTAQIDTAITNGEILVFITHSGGGSFTSGGGGTTRLADVIAYAQAHNVPIVTPGEAFDMVRNIIDTGDYVGGIAYSVIDGTGRLFSPAPTQNIQVLEHASDALTKLPSAFPLGITVQQYMSSSGAPGSGPGTVQTVKVIGGTSDGGLNFQFYSRNLNGGLYLRHAAANHGSWGAWKQLATTADFPVQILGHAADALTKLPSAFTAGIALQQYQSSSGAPGAGPGTVETVIVDTSGTVGGLNFQRYMRNSNAGTYIRHAATDNASWGAWKPIATVVSIPASASATGTPGQWAVDSSYVYYCTATNTWVRAAVATW